MFNPRGVTLTAMRFLTAVDMNEPQHTEKLSRQLWMQIWNQVEATLCVSTYIVRFSSLVLRMLTKLECLHLNVTRFSYIMTILGRLCVSVYIANFNHWCF